MCPKPRSIRAVSEDGLSIVVLIEPDLIGGVAGWEIWDSETFETLNREPIPDTGQDAAQVLRQWEQEQGER